MGTVLIHGVPKITYTLKKLGVQAAGMYDHPAEPSQRRKKFTCTRTELKVSGKKSNEGYQILKDAYPEPG